jgi:hypothetical protein
VRHKKGFVSRLVPGVHLRLKEKADVFIGYLKYFLGTSVSNMLAKNEIYPAIQ